MRFGSSLRCVLPNTCAKTKSENWERFLQSCTNVFAVLSNNSLAIKPCDSMRRTESCRATCWQGGANEKSWKQTMLVCNFEMNLAIAECGCVVLWVAAHHKTSGGGCGGCQEPPKASHIPSVSVGGLLDLWSSTNSMDHQDFCSLLSGCEALELG